MVQALLARQQLEDEEKVERRSGVPVPSDISTSSALAQAMLARQGADDQDEGLYWMHDKHPSSSSALAQAMQARRRAQVQEGEEYYSTEVFSESPVNTSVSNVMMQVMQRAEEEDRMQWAPAPPQNPAPAGSSALIQAMLARQQAQNEYDDGY